MISFDVWVTRRSDRASDGPITAGMIPTRAYLAPSRSFDASAHSAITVK